MRLLGKLRKNNWPTDEHFDFWDLVDRLDNRRKIEQMQGHPYFDPKARRERISFLRLMNKPYNGKEASLTANTKSPVNLVFERM